MRASIRIKSTLYARTCAGCFFSFPLSLSIACVSVCHMCRVRQNARMLAVHARRTDEHFISALFSMAHNGHNDSPTDHRACTSEEEMRAWCMCARNVFACVYILWRGEACLKAHTRRERGAHPTYIYIVYMQTYVQYSGRQYDWNV